MLASHDTQRLATAESWKKEKSCWMRILLFAKLSAGLQWGRMSKSRCQPWVSCFCQVTGSLTHTVLWKKKFEFTTMSKDGDPVENEEERSLWTSDWTWDGCFCGGRDKTLKECVSWRWCEACAAVQPCAKLAFNICQCSGVLKFEHNLSVFGGQRESLQFATLWIDWKVGVLLRISPHFATVTGSLVVQCKTHHLESEALISSQNNYHLCSHLCCLDFTKIELVCADSTWLVCGPMRTVRCFPIRRRIDFRVHTSPK